MAAPIVLIVDDDVEVAELTCEVVELGGVKAVYRTSVVDAIDYLARNAGTVVAVLTDIHLGSPMSGIDLAMHIDVAWPTVAVCVVTGFAGTPPTRLPSRAIFLSKPWRGADLIAFVNRAAGR